MATDSLSDFLNSLRVKQQKTKTESLCIQLDLIESLILRHQIWAGKAKDLEVGNFHVEIIARLQTIASLYRKKLNA